MKLLKKLLILAFTLGLLGLVTAQYVGYYYFNAYKNARAEARSIEKSFPDLEKYLKRSVDWSGNPEFFKELARLYLERALAENEFGTPEKRDLFLDSARESLARAIKKNPADAFAYYEMGKVWLLYNFPLLTYLDQGKRYFVKALELKPADEFLGLNILYIYLTQWNFLSGDEQKFVLKKLRSMERANKDFMAQLRNRWLQNFSDDQKLKEIVN
jgi:hypothetical protein